MPLFEDLDAFLTTVKCEGPKLDKTLPQVMDEPDQSLLSPSKLLSEKGNTNTILELVLICLRLDYK
jgi:hypothetical protein